MSVVRATLSAESLLGPPTLNQFFRVLMLRRKASPTQTELRLEHSAMINEALEMIEVALHSNQTSNGTSDGCMPSISLDTHTKLEA